MKTWSASSISWEPGIDALTGRARRAAGVDRHQARSGIHRSTLYQHVAAAGGTGIGVYQAAKDAGKLAIGVDSNQNHIQPGTMLTSMLKRVDVAVYNVAKGHKPGLSVFGLKEEGVGYAMDKNNEKLVSADMGKKVEAAKADILSGKIKVVDYMTASACKY